MIMYMQCPKCGSKHFLISIINQENGSDDSYEFYCAGCGEFIDPYKNDEDDVETYIESEIDKVQRGNESICLEKWIEYDVIVYVVSLYRGEDMVCDRDFDTVEDAQKCYKKCTDLFESTGKLDVVVKLFDDC
jgi:hypothetical protein